MRNERKCEVVLEEQGWRIMFRSVRVRMQRIDFDNTFDIVAKKGKQRRLVQSKTNLRPGEVLKEYEKIIKWVDENGLPGERGELWIHYDRKSPTIIKEGLVTKIYGV